MRLRNIVLMLTLALSLPALSQAAGRRWSVRYAPSFSVSSPSFQRQGRTPRTAQNFRKPTSALRYGWNSRVNPAVPLNLKGKTMTLNIALNQTLINSMNRQAQILTPQVASARRVQARRVRVGGFGVNSSGYQFPLR
jgi:hypothetical protein